MTLQLETRHDLSPNEIDAIEDRLYDHNSHATGRHDGQGLGFVIRDEAGQMIGVAAGYTWAGISELKQMWVDQAYRGRGYARALLDAFVEEARSRGVRRIWVASYDFQAPGMYEKAGFKRMAEFEGGPRATSMWFSAKHYKPQVRSPLRVKKTDLTARNSTSACCERTNSCLRGPLNPLRRSGGAWLHRKESLARCQRYRGCGFGPQQVV